MTDKQLKKLKRPALLEILVAQNKENDALREEIASLKQQLEERNMQIERAGSIAEAALSINEVFAKAQEAAELYLENVKRMADAGVPVDLTEPAPGEKRLEEGTEENSESNNEDSSEDSTEDSTEGNPENDSADA